MTRTFGHIERNAPATPSRQRGLDRQIAALLDFVTVSHQRVLAFLVICGLIFFLPGFFHIPPVDRDEARFAQATKQMVETGDYIDIRFQDEVRYKKPVGIYWMQSALVNGAIKAGIPGAKVRIWIYRIPSLAGAIGAVLLTYWAALAFLTRRGALLAAMTLCASILLGVEARLAKTDAMLLMMAVAAMGAMARVYLRWQRDGDDGPSGPEGWLMPGIFWTALAAGLLIKGPLVLMFAVTTAITLAILDRSAGWIWRLRPIWGVLWMLVLALPWFIAIVLKSGDSFFAQSIGGDLMTKVAGGQESHGAPPGYYLALFWLTFWPGAPLTAMAAPAIYRAWRQPGAAFLLAWIIPCWLIFEAVPTKLPHYVLPLYPAIAILTIGALELRVLSSAAWLKRGAGWWFWLPAIISVGAIIAAIMLIRQPLFAAWPFAAMAAIFGLAAWWLFDENRAERSIVKAVAASALMSACVFGIVIPSLTPLFPSAQIGKIIRATGCERPTIAAAAFHEPSLVFMVGTQTKLTSATAAADFLMSGGCHFAIVESRQERAFAQRGEEIGLRYSITARVNGFNISQGKAIILTIFEGEGRP